MTALVSAFRIFACFLASGKTKYLSGKNLEEVEFMAENQISVNERRRCREIMTRSVTTATREMSLQVVAALMRDGDMGSLPVIENGKLVGIVTDRDIVVRAVAEGKDAATAIGDVMTAEIFAGKPKILFLKRYA